MKLSNLTRQIAHAGKPIVVCSGGTNSGKTYGILHYLIHTAIAEPRQVITVAGQDVPNLRKGAYRDAKHIIFSDPQLDRAVADHNKSQRKFTFATGSVLEFDSFSDAQDAKNGKRDYLFVNEANGVPYDVYQVLADRTASRVLIDFNPSNRFWAHEKLERRADVYWHHSTYKDNPATLPSIRKKIEAYEPTAENIEAGTANEWYWKVYGLGQLASREGAVYTNWRTGDYGEFPDPSECKHHLEWLDFGFSNSPTAMGEMRLTSGGKLYASEHVYETGLTNQDISEKMYGIGISWPTIADSAEPKSIEELCRLGHDVRPARKGNDSLEHGIQQVQQLEIIVDSTSKNLIREFEAYRWDKDRTGMTLNRPVKSMDHHLDGIRYDVSWAMAPQIDYSVF